MAFVAATVTAFIAVKWLLGYIQTHRFTAFAVYRVILAIVLLPLVPRAVSPARARGLRRRGRRAWRAEHRRRAAAPA